MLSFNIRPFFILGVLIIFNNLYAQPYAGYSPLCTHSEASSQLIKSIKDQRDKDVKEIHSSNKSLAAKIYSARANRLIEQIRKGKFIRNDTLQRFVDAVMERILLANKIDRQPKRILILRDPGANAFCYGEGTFIVTIGLLGRIDNESQLAYTMSHELAHYELNHVNDKIERIVEMESAERSQKGLFKTVDDETLLQNLDSLRDWIYGESRFSRKTELDADALGFEYFSRTDYGQSEALTLLKLLNRVPGDSHLGQDLFSPFHSAKYPFSEYWLKPRLGIYHKKPTGTYAFSYDSIHSHPDADNRSASLKPRMKPGHSEIEVSEEFKNVNTTARFESIASAYFTKEYDHCMYLALELFIKYPHDPYLVSMISKIFVELLEAKSEGSFEGYVRKYTTSYGDDLRLVNNFLYNLTENEMGEIAYHFLNNKSNFDVKNEEHYYLLWKICEWTKRFEVQKKIKNSYAEKFGKGSYTMH